MNKLTVKISSPEPIKVTAKEAVVVQSAPNGNQQSQDAAIFKKQLASTINELEETKVTLHRIKASELEAKEELKITKIILSEIQLTLESAQAESEAKRIEIEFTKSELNEAKIQLEQTKFERDSTKTALEDTRSEIATAHQKQGELSQSLHHQQQQLDSLTSNIATAKTAIMAALQSKGVASTGNLADFAREIEQISTATKTEKNYKIEKQETELSFGIIKNMYTDGKGGDIAYSGWDISTYIDIEGAEYISVTHNSHQYSCYYDENKKSLGSIKTAYYEKVPVTAKYVRVSNTSAALSQTKVMIGKVVVVEI